MFNETFRGIMKKNFLCMVAVGFLFSNFAMALELKGKNTIDMKTDQEIEEFVLSLSPSELEEAIKQLRGRKEDCINSLYLSLGYRMQEFSIDGKIPRKNRSELRKKMLQQKEQCDKNQLWTSLK